MTVIFPKWTNLLPALLGLTAACAGSLVTGVVWIYFSPEHTDVGYSPDQPVFYSHKLHAGLMGMDCRYCHQHVETSPHATVPTTETCMNCHATVLTDRDAIMHIKRVHDAGEPMPWVKVHLLPDYAYFNHSAHIGAGVGCVSCHGRVDQMEIVRQEKALSMGWCLDCHRDPELHLRPDGISVTDMAYIRDPDDGLKLMEARNLQPPVHCSGCHR